MNVPSSVSWVGSIITFFKNKTDEGALYVAFFSLVVAALAFVLAFWTSLRSISLQKQMRDLQKNPAELAGVQLEQISEAKLKTMLEVTYKRGEDRIGIFTIQNTGSSDARDIKLKIDTPRSQSAYVNYREFLTKDGTFELPDLNPGQYHSVSINWDSSDSRADVSWSWVNADASSASRQHTFDRWS